MKYALVGCGRIAKKHIIAAQAAGMEICGLCDIDLAQAKILQNEFHLQHIPVFSRLEDMLEQCRPKLVAIASPSNFHGSQALVCLHNDVHIIIEKPMALSLKECDEIIELSERKGILVSVCHQNRFNPSAVVCKELLQDKKVGEILYMAGSLRWNRDENYYAQAEWRGKWESDGGVLMNQGIHYLDMMLWLGNGSLYSIMGSVSNLSHPYLETEDTAFSMAQLNNGVRIIADATTCAYKENLEEAIIIFAQEGVIRLGGTSLNQLDFWKTSEGSYRNSSTTTNSSDIYGSGHKALYQNMKHCIKTGEQPAITGIHGRNAVEYVLSIYESARREKKIYLPKNGMCCKNFKGVFDFDWK